MKMGFLLQNLSFSVLVTLCGLRYFSSSRYSFPGVMGQGIRSCFNWIDHKKRYSSLYIETGATQRLPTHLSLVSGVTNDKSLSSTKDLITVENTSDFFGMSRNYYENSTKPFLFMVV